jgi:hypothetical protein
MRSLAVACVLLAGCRFAPGQLAASDARGGDAAGTGSDAIVANDGPAADAGGRQDAAGSDGGTQGDVDTDGDGVPDPTDDCPMMADPDQRDFDGDGHGDPCDRCPHLYSTDDLDGDGDGVGDACDPRPGLQDRRALWTGFYDASELVGWTTSGSWTVTNGHVVQSSTAGQAFLTAPGTVARPYVATAVTPISLGVGIPAVALSLTAAHSYGCGIYVMNGAKAFAETDGGMTAIQTASWSGAVPGSEVTLIQNLVSRNACDVQDAAYDAPVSSTELGNSSSTISLSTQSASASFAYLFVVDTGP